MKKNGSRPGLAVLLALLVAVTMLVPAASWTAQAGGGSGATVELPAPAGFETDASGNAMVTTGTEFTVRPNITVSGVLEDGSYLTVSAPKKYLEATNYHFLNVGSTGDVASISYSSSSAEIQSVTLKFHELSAANVEIPVVVKVPNMTVPPDSTFDVNAVLYAPDGTVLSQDKITIHCVSSYIEAWGTKDLSYNLEEAEASADGTKTSDDLSKLTAQEIDLEKMIKFCSIHGTGEYMPQNFRIVVQLTDSRAVFDSAFGNNRNTNASEGWVYDASSRTASLTVKKHSYASSYLYLKLKDFPFSTSSTGTPIAKVHLVELDDDLNVVTGHDTNTSTMYVSLKRLVAEKSMNADDAACSNLARYGWYPENRGRVTTWGLRYKNKISNADIQPGETLPDGSDANYYFNSFNMRLRNPHVYYTTFRICGDETTAQKAQVEKNQLYGVTKDGTETLIAENVKIGQTVTIPQDKAMASSGGYRGLRIVFPDKCVVRANEQICFENQTKVFEDDWDKGRQTGSSWHLDGETLPLLNESIDQDFVAKYRRTPYTPDDNHEIAANSSLSYRISSGGEASLNLKSEPSETITQGNYASLEINPDLWNYGPTGERTADGDFDFVNPKAVVLIPDGWEYVEDEYYGGISVTYFNKDDSSGHYKYIPGKVVDNFNGTGKKALVIDQIGNEYFIYKITPNLRPTTSAPEGDAKVTVYYAYDNNGAYQAVPKDEFKEVDKWDLNGNGKTTDYILKNEITLKYVPSKSFSGLATAGKTADATTVSGVFDAGSADGFYLGLSVHDGETAGSVRSFSALDVLPRQGDTKILPGNGKVRSSDFDVQLTGPVKILKDGALADPEAAGYTVTYSTDKAADQDLAANLQKSFTADTSGWTASDWAKVTMFRIEMKSGTTIQVGKDVTFAAPAKASGGSAGKTAQNTFVYAKSGEEGTTLPASSYLESNLVKIRYAKEDTPTPVAYHITKGDGQTWTKNTETGISLTSDGPFDKLTSATIDGAAIDPSYLQASSDGTEVTLPASYLEALAAGRHTLVLKYSDGTADGAAGTFTVKNPTYHIIAGDGSTWTKGQGGAAGTVSMTADGPFAKFTDLQVDGADLDASNYDAVSGSTIATLKASYLKTLSAGSHTLTFVYTDGSATGTFRVLNAPPKAYKIIEGDKQTWTKGTETGVTLTSDGPFDKLTSAAIDGAAIDPSYMQASSDGTEVTLPASYLETLAAGTHTLVLKYSDGTAEGAAGTFTVKAAPEEPDQPTVDPGKTDGGKNEGPKDGKPAKSVKKSAPRTGDDADRALWAAVIAAAAGVAALAASRKKKTR